MPGRPGGKSVRTLQQWPSGQRPAGTDGLEEHLESQLWRGDWEETDLTRGPRSSPTRNVPASVIFEDYVS